MVVFFFGEEQHIKYHISNNKFNGYRVFKDYINPSDIFIILTNQYINEKFNINPRIIIKTTVINNEYIVDKIYSNKEVSELIKVYNLLK